MLIITIIPNNKFLEKLWKNGVDFLYAIGILSEEMEWINLDLLQDYFWLKKKMMFNLLKKDLEQRLSLCKNYKLNFGLSMTAIYLLKERHWNKLIKI